MQLVNFKTIYTLVDTLYGISIDESSFEDIGLLGLKLIGNNHTHLYKYIAKTKDKQVKLPCNVELIESVTSATPDFQKTSPIVDGVDVGNLYTEGYIEALKSNYSPLYTSGQFLKYREEGDILLFDRDYDYIIIIYHGTITDEDGLPLITIKEARAIATYIAYSLTYRKALSQGNSALFQFSQTLEAKWLKACTAARIPDIFTQNDMDDLLDARVRCERKQYKKSFKPLT